MTISVWGWGTTTISTWGWGGYYYIIPELSAQFKYGYTYSCVISREYTEVADRATGEILFRTVPEEILGRTYDEILNRVIDDVLFRSDGWNCQVSSRSDGYLEIKSRDVDNITIRVRPDEIPERQRGEILQRINTSPISRSAGWPWQSDTCVDE